MPRKATHRKKRSRTPRPGRHFLSKVTGLGFLALVAYAWLTLAVPPTALGTSDPALPLWQVYWLRTRLERNLEMLNNERGRNAVTEDFFVQPGEPASAVSVRLAERDIVPDARLLRDYLVYKGLDSQVEAGFFQFRPAMTTVEVATTPHQRNTIQSHISHVGRLETRAGCRCALTASTPSS